MPWCLGEGCCLLLCLLCKGLMALSRFCRRFQQGHPLGLLCHPDGTVDPVPKLRAERCSLRTGRKRSQESVWCQGRRQPPVPLSQVELEVHSLTKQPVMLPPETLCEGLARPSTNSMSSTEGQGSGCLSLPAPKAPGCGPLRRGPTPQKRHALPTAASAGEAARRNQPRGKLPKRDNLPYGCSVPSQCTNG